MVFTTINVICNIRTGQKTFMFSVFPGGACNIINNFVVSHICCVAVLAIKFGKLSGIKGLNRRGGCYLPLPLYRPRYGHPFGFVLVWALL